MLALIISSLRARWRWLRQTVNHWLDVPVSDPGDARRRRVFNMLVGSGLIIFLIFVPIMIFYDHLSIGYDWPSTLKSYPGTLSAIVFSFIGLRINRWRFSWAGRLAAGIIVFVVFFAQVVWLYSDPGLIKTYYLTYILVSGFACLLLSSRAGMWMGLLCAPFILHQQMLAGEVVLYDIMYYMGSLLPFWLTTNRLEAANRDLERRVQTRTRELYEALTRTHELMGREHALAERHKTIVNIVSHDLRNPVGRVTGFAEILLKADDPLSDEQRDILRRIVRASKQQEHLIADLLDNARIEAGTLRLHQVAFAPARLLEEMRELLHNKVETKGLTLEIGIGPDMPATLVGDAQRLHQILNNLVTNAIKFTVAGRVSVRVYCADAAHWALEVKDTGCGIPPEAQAAVFEPYRQLVGEQRAQGIGLGLSIVKSLVTLMQGEIKLHSAVGKGSTFTVVLPIVTGD